MSANIDFERLELIFRRSRTLPELQGTVYKLISAIDAKDSSVIDLERIISSDPYLTANLLRIAAFTGGFDERCSTLRMAIMKLGFRAVRSMAVSILLKGIVSKSDYASGFDPKRFSRHSLFVGFMSRYLYARRQQVEPFTSGWTADEIFAAGLLHDMASGLLAHLTPEVYSRVHSFAHRSQTTLDAAFKRIFGQHLGVLGSVAASAWSLPDVFVKTMSALEEPWLDQDEYTSLCCVNYANYLANKTSNTIVTWPTQVEVSPEVQLEVRFPESEIEEACSVVERHTEAYLQMTGAYEEIAA